MSGQLDAIMNMASRSPITSYHWKDRGPAPAGYVKGMAVMYARVYCGLKRNEQAALEMAKADTHNKDRDALSWYSELFVKEGMNNSVDGIATLRHLFVLLTGLGMRESSGKYCAGRDATAANTAAETAEAGLFQTSFNARSANPLMSQLFQQYSNKSDFLDIFLDIFKKGVHCTTTDLELFGSGQGRDFQALSKRCPAFAVEFAAVGLRNVRKHWGPINAHAAELRFECDELFRHIEVLLEQEDLCPSLNNSP